MDNLSPVSDPIVEEVRAARDDIARAHNYNIGAIVRALQQQSAESGHTLVSFPPKRIE